MHTLQARQRRFAYDHQIAYTGITEAGVVASMTLLCAENEDAKKNDMAGNGMKPDH